MLALAAGAPSAAAQSPDVGQLIELVRSKPDGMTRADWKEKRRSAVKTLGNAGDKRAVPVLIEVVRTEEFDVVAEHAIVALGKLGDQRAVPVLQQVVADQSRDRVMRDKARAALQKLGADPGAKGKGDPVDGGSTPVGGAIGGGAVRIPTGPQFASDVLGATERITLAIGAARLEYDTLFDRPTLDGNVSALYERTRDMKSWAYRYRADAAVVGGYVDHDYGPGNTSGRAYILNVNTRGMADARFYLSGRPLYGLVGSALDVSITKIKVDRDDSNDINLTQTNADLGASIGVGFGRVLDVGQALRLRRIELVLTEARALGRKISPALAERIMRAWWSLRNELGFHQRLTITVKMLREAGVLLGEPDASTTYKILQVLQDGQLMHRPSGLDVSLAVAESYLVRDDDPGLPEGRFESALLRARFGKQNATGTHEIVGEGFGRYRFGDTNPWAVSAAAAWRKYFYGKYADPIGALEIAAELAYANDDVSGTTGAYRAGGRIGWVWAQSRRSRFRVSGNARLESGELFIGGSLEATYGFLDVGFVGGPTYGKLR